jgi:hypothetical protein
MITRRGYYRGSDSGGADARAGGAAHTTPALRSALVLVEASPRAVLFRPGKGVIETFGAYGALGADGLGLALANVALRLTLAVRTEEEHKVLSPARGIILPTPTRAGAGDLPTYLRHETTTLGERYFVIYAALDDCWHP